MLFLMQPPDPAPHRRMRFGLPSPAMAPWLLVFTACMLNPSSLILDPGTGWHLASGQWMLENRAVITHDPFSFTATARPFPSHEWLFQVAAAILVFLSNSTLHLLIIAASVVSALTVWVVSRRLAFLGCPWAINIALSVPLSVIIVGHTLTRPHVLTYLLFAAWPAWLVWCEKSRSMFPVVLGSAALGVLWANLHGGFLVVFPFTLLTLLGARLDSSTRTWSLPNSAERSSLTVLAAFFVGTLFTPWSADLYAHLSHALSIRSNRFWDEFTPPAFTLSNQPIVAFFALLGLLLLLSARAGPIAWKDLLPILFFAAAALSARRHMTLLAIVALPVLGYLTLRWLRQAASPDLLRRFVRPPASSPPTWDFIWMVPFLCFLTAASTPLTQALDFGTLTLGGDGVAFLRKHQAQLGRTFNTDDLGGPLIHTLWPAHKVFVDDRNPFYGDAFILGEYLPLLNVRPNCLEILESHKIDSAIVPATSALATLLASDPGWHAWFSGSRIAVFSRRGPPPPITD